MNRTIKLPTDQMLEIKRLLSAQDSQTLKALGQQLEWRLFLLLLEAYCAARHWEVEYATADDGSVAIFADNDCGGCNPADAWYQEILLPESVEQ
jgi:hypothetical protein